MQQNLIPKENIESLPEIVTLAGIGLMPKKVFFNGAFIDFNKDGADIINWGYDDVGTRVLSGVLFHAIMDLMGIKVTPDMDKAKDLLHEALTVNLQRTSFQVEIKLRAMLLSLYGYVAEPKQLSEFLSYTEITVINSIKAGRYVGDLNSGLRS